MQINKKHRKRSILAMDDHKKVLHKNLDFTAREQYKLLRANLSFTLPDDQKCPIIGITSSVRGEGKSTTAINLAYVLAESGKRVLLIDGDLRLSSISKKMEIRSTPGLTNLLLGFESQQLGDFKSDLLDNWYIIPAGDIPPNPSELLGSRKMENLLRSLSERFDYIVIDLPPVNIVSDALAISNLISGMIVVVREEYTEKKEFEACVRQLRLSNIKVLGCVMNVTKTGGGGYSRYKKYYKYYHKRPYKEYKEYEES